MTAELQTPLSWGETQIEINLADYVPGLYSVVSTYQGSITGRGSCKLR